MSQAQNWISKAQFILSTVDPVTLSVLAGHRTGPTWREILCEVASGDLDRLDSDITGVCHPITFEWDDVTLLEMFLRIHDHVIKWREALTRSQKTWN